MSECRRGSWLGSRALTNGRGERDEPGAARRARGRKGSAHVMRVVCTPSLAAPLLNAKIRTLVGGEKVAHQGVRFSEKTISSVDRV